MTDRISILQMGMAWFAEQPGGLDRYYAGLLAHLDAAGVNVRGLVTGSPQVTVESGGKINAFARADEGLPTRWRKVRKAVDAELADGQLDAWASHFALYSFPLLRRLQDLPHIIHFHGPWAEESQREGAGAISVRLKAALEKRVYRSGTRLIVLSDAFRDVLIRNYGVDPAKVRVIPGGVEFARFDISTSRAAARTLLGWPADRPILLCVRRLVQRMGLHLLLDAMVTLKQRSPDLLCLIGGKGPLADELQSAIAARGLADHVRLLGFVSEADLPLAYRAADLSVVPSEAWEGFGLITAESLAAGTPVAVTPVGGLPEVVRPFRPELVADATTANALARCIGAYFSSSAHQIDQSACQNYARENFDWPIIAARVARVYREACIALS